MALSMDEQRMLAEIERRLAAEDPGLATRLSSFRKPGPAAGFRSTRAKIIGSVCTVVLLAAIALTVYAMMPFRAGAAKAQLSRPSSGSPAATAPVRSGSSAQRITSGSTTAADASAASSSRTAG